MSEVPLYGRTCQPTRHLRDMPRRPRENNEPTATFEHNEPTATFENTEPTAIFDDAGTNR